LSTPDGLIDVDVRVTAVSVDAIIAEFDVSSSVHLEALEQGWFHLGGLSSGIGAGPFEPDATVRIEASLDPRLVAGLVQVVATPDGVTELLGALGPTSELCSQASWYALAATAEVTADGADDEMPAEVVDALATGSLREGYRTMWASESGAGLTIVGHLAEVLERRFDGVQPLAENPGFRWTLTGTDASWTTMAVVDETAGWCVLYSVLAAEYDASDRDLLIERTAQLSSGLLFGSWHITDGPLQVRFRSAIELPDRTGATTLLDRLVTRHLDIVDEYANAFSLA
jgi:hypothetical protein